MPLERLDHVLVLTDDIDGTRDFWRDVVGLQEGDRPPLEFPGHWLYAGGVAAVHVAERAAYTSHARATGVPMEEPGGPGPVDHVAFRGTGYEDAVARLERHGVDAVRNEIPSAGLRQLFFTDPNGVRVEINVFS